MFISRIVGSVTRNSLKFGLKSSIVNARFNSGITIGVDLGTTNSCVAIMEGSEPRVIVNAEGARTTPSIVAFTDDNQKLVGEAAKRQAISNSKNTIYGTKRLIGRRFKEKEVQDEIPHLPFELCEHSNGDCWVKVKGSTYSPSQIGGMVLGKMKETAENYVGLKIKDAVITVPAYFNDSQRQATKDAGAIAGLNVVRIINEPTAAALAYGLSRKTDNKRIAVYDLGGGTFDISVLEMNEGVFEVKSTNGDTRLGGEDFDNVIIKYLIEQINAKLKTDVKQDLKALQRIKEAAEKAKCELSFSNETEINLPYLIGAQSYSQKLSRPQLEKLVSALIQRTIEPCEKALKDANVSVKDLDEVILVGGMTRMPKVQSTVKEFFKREPSKSVNPDEAVAMGASIQGGVLAGKVSDIVLVDITPYSLGVLTLGGIFAPVVPRCTAIPTKKSEIFTTSADNQTMIEVSVFQGERTMCNLNTSLGAFMLGPIPPRPKGASQIEVTFEIDSNGIVHVSALDVISNHKAHTTLKSNPRGLSKEELEKIAKESEKERENDQKLKKAIETKLQCESQCDDLKNLLLRVRDHMESTEFDQYEKEIATMAADAIATPPKTIDFYNDLLKKITECVLKLREIEDKKTSQSQEPKSDTPTEQKNPE